MITFSQSGTDDIKIETLQHIPKVGDFVDVDDGNDNVKGNVKKVTYSISLDSAGVPYGNPSYRPILKQNIKIDVD